MARTRSEYLERPTKAEARRAVDAIGRSLLITNDRMQGWLDEVGREHLRAVRAGGGDVVGGCMLYPLGQWFGGRCVPMTGVAGVGIAPESRARGAATAMMQGVVRETAARGIAITSLYPATQPVYRAAGWEQAGVRLAYLVDAAVLPTDERDVPVHVVKGRSSRALERLYRRVAAGGNGWLDRAPFQWKWILPGTKSPGRRAYLVGNARDPEGWVAFDHVRRPDSFRGRLEVRDVGFVTPRAGRRILALLAAHRSVAAEIVWHGGPADPLLVLLREQEVTPRKTFLWMVRIGDLRAALTERGYPAGLEAEVAFTVEDPLVPRNRGTWVLRVKNGRGRATKSKTPRPDALALDVRTLAPIWTGWQTPREVQRWDRVEGPDASLDAVGAVFAGPTPSMREMF